MCSQYWPSLLNQPEVYGDIEVMVTLEEYLANFVIRNIKIMKVGIWSYQHTQRLSRLIK